MTLYGSELWTKRAPRTKSELTIDGSPRPAIVHSRGMLFTDQRGNMVLCGSFVLRCKNDY